jgi:signal transduction histidine kinase
MLEGEDSERKRLAKELHDGLGGLLSTIKLSFSQTWSRSEGDRGRATLLIDKAHGELRRIAHNLMPGTLLKYGLISAVEELCDEINYTGHLKVSFQHFGVKAPIPDHFSFQIYRILQELLQNVIKHADAREVLVQLIQRNEQLILTVEDDGTGLPDDFDRKAGLGMNNLQSRVNLLNAAIQMETKKGEGTTFTITIPTKELHD